MSDRILGGVGLALAVFYIWAASIIPDSFMMDAVGPRTFPYIIGAILAICSVVFMLKPDADPEWPDVSGLLEVLCATVVLFLYAALLARIGFIVSTALATTYLTWRLGSNAMGSVMTGVFTSVGIYVVFHLVLGLSLARGPWGF